MKDLELMAKEFIRWVDAITSDDFRGDVDKALFKQFFDQSLLEVRKDAYKECAEIARKYGEETYNIYEPQDICNLILAKMEELK